MYYDKIEGLGILFIFANSDTCSIFSDIFLLLYVFLTQHW